MILANPATSAPAQEMIALDNVSWELYDMLLDETSEQHVRITYDNGRMVIMSPLPIHDLVKGFLGRLIEMATLEWNIPLRSYGSTTWKRQDLAKGLEADESYFIQHEQAAQGLKYDWDSAKMPPPDLVVEVDLRHIPIERSKIYAALGVPEIWRFDGEKVEFLLLNASGQYETISHSHALARISSADVNDFLHLLGTVDDTRLMRQIRDWLRTLG